MTVRLEYLEELNESIRRLDVHIKDLRKALEIMRNKRNKLMSKSFEDNQISRK